MPDVDAAVAELRTGPEDFYQIASTLTQRLELVIFDEVSFKMAVNRLFALVSTASRYISIIFVLLKWKFEIIDV